MRIAICGSMSFAKGMLAAGDFLGSCGVEYDMPEGVREYASGKIPVGTFGGSVGAKRKIDHGLIRKHWEKIAKSDAILIINLRKDETDHYIGGNTFLEMGFAHVLGKRIFLLNPIPDQPIFGEEMEAMQPIILHGDFHNLRTSISLFWS